MEESAIQAEERAAKAQKRAANAEARAAEAEARAAEAEAQAARERARAEMFAGDFRTEFDDRSKLQTKLRKLQKKVFCSVCNLELSSVVFTSCTHMVCCRKCASNPATETCPACHGKITGMWFVTW